MSADLGDNVLQIVLNSNGLAKNLIFDMRYDYKVSSRIFGSQFYCQSVFTTVRRFRTPTVKLRWISKSTDPKLSFEPGFSLRRAACKKQKLAAAAYARCFLKMIFWNM